MMEDELAVPAQNTLAKAATRIALYLTREECDKTMEQKEIQHAHDFFVVNATRVSEYLLFVLFQMFQRFLCFCKGTNPGFVTTIDFCTVASIAQWNVTYESPLGIVPVPSEDHQNHSATDTIAVYLFFVCELIFY